jgi:hypothetical protein
MTNNAPTGVDQSSDNTEPRSISRGGIAGIVVGTLVGVVLLAVSGWVFFDRQLKRSSNTESPAAVPSDAGAQEKLKPSGAFSQATTRTFGPQYDPNQRPAELIGSDGLVEMSDTHQIAELDTNETSLGRIRHELASTVKILGP